MSVKTIAVEIYEKEKKLAEEKDAEEEKKFVEEAFNTLTKMIDVQRADVMMVVKQPGTVRLLADDVLFEVKQFRGCFNVSVVVKCSRCGSEAIVGVLSMRDIGRALVEPHFKYDCDMEIEREKNKNEKVLSSGERLLEALRDFMFEGE